MSMFKFSESFDRDGRTLELAEEYSTARGETRTRILRRVRLESEEPDAVAAYEEKRRLFVQWILEGDMGGEHAK